MKSNLWKIKCANTPEIIDRLVAPFRKRGLKLTEFKFIARNENVAVAEIAFDCPEESLVRIHSNLVKIVDVFEVEDLLAINTEVKFEL